MPNMTWRANSTRSSPAHEAELIDFRRDLHAHPELGYHEHRTTRRIALRLAAAGLRPTILPKGTGLLVDIGSAPPSPVVACAPTLTRCRSATRRTFPTGPRSPTPVTPAATTCTPRSCSAPGCSWPARRRPERCPGRVRLIFQPAEEVPAGPWTFWPPGGIASVDRIFALHCDPRLDVGKIGTRVGAITAACDKITVRVTGPGGHTARPHLTADLVYALGKIVTELPAALSRRVDPRSSLSLVWGQVSAGAAANAIPDDGMVEGTVRCLDDEAWHQAPDLLKALDRLGGQRLRGRGRRQLHAERAADGQRGHVSTAMLAAAAERVLGPDAVASTPQSLGGEDFAWYLESVPGALARLGTRTPGSGDDFDIHQPAFDVDERAIGIGRPADGGHRADRDVRRRAGRARAAAGRRPGLSPAGWPGLP